MKTYLVGGAVRDELLGLPISERDWVVVGATPEEMISQGFQPVGKDFPVFLHPETKEEFALARTERKQGRGYHGFTVYAEPDVSLEDDLRRRDLTINAMAKEANGEIIDPYGGQEDIKNRLLRHVSPSFSEDPLRVLRAARFAAKFASLGFSIADETQQLMRDIVTTQEITEIAKDRVWLETCKALSTDSPDIYFSVLHDVHALQQIYPNINEQFLNREHREHGLNALRELVETSTDIHMRFAAFIGGLYFGNNKKDNREDVRALLEHLCLPNACKELLLLTITVQHKCHNVFNLNANELHALLRSMDARRKPERFENLLVILSAIYTSAEKAEKYPQANFLRAANQEIEQVNIEPWVNAQISNEELANNLRTAQIEALQKFFDEFEAD